MTSFPKDLTGMTFGEWTVLYPVDNHKWRCKCSCGIERDVLRDNLISGGSTSCGHDSNKDQLIDLTGVKVGKLEVIEYVKELKKWLCRCECGNTCYKRSYDIRNNKAKTCGKCKNTSNRLVDLVGQTFGELTVEKYLGDSMWLCKCSCGEYKEVYSSRLKDGSVTSCGHMLNQSKVIDLKGIKFGKLTPLEYIGGSKWRCICDCGNERIVSTAELRSGKVIQCRECAENKSSLKFDLTGKRFGYLEVLSYNKKINKCLCKCHLCGNTKYIYSQHLRRGDSVTCGCTHATINIEDIVTCIESLKLDLDRKPYIYEVSEMIGASEKTIREKLKNNNLINLLGVNTQSSSYEQELLNFIKSLCNYDIEQHFKVDGIEIDIYIPELKLGFEFNGNYWHSDIHKDMMFHQNKTIKCAQHNIRLVHIFEYEWLNVKFRSKIESFIIDLLNDKKQIIYAKDTYIKEIDTIMEKEFLNKYHLQGYTSSSVKIGLFNKDSTLLGVMTFGKPRFNQNYEYELIRLAFKSNYIVVGGLEKLFNYFIAKYNPNSIVSYCNLAKFYGNSYLKLGFKSELLTLPNYIWVDKRSKTVLSRYSTQKHLLVKEGLGTAEQTEDEIMKGLHYLKLYDSGNIKLSWHK